MTHSIISLVKGVTLDPCKELVSPVGSVGASKGRWPFEVAVGDPHPSALLLRASCPEKQLVRFSEGHFDPLILANCQPDTLQTTPPYMARFRSIAAYMRTEKGTHVRSKTPKFSVIGGHALQPLGVRSGCTRASMPTKPRTHRPEELMILLVCSRLYLRWLVIRA